MCAGGSAGSGAVGSSSGIAGVFFGVLRGLGTLASSLPARPLERGFLPLLTALAPPFRALPLLPPSPNPSHLFGDAFALFSRRFRSVRACFMRRVCPLRVPLCRLREAAQIARAAARAASTPAGAVGTLAAVWARVTPSIPAPRRPAAAAQASF